MPWPIPPNIIRGGIELVPRQQVEAAQAMNFSRLQTLFMVQMPQAWPVIVPPAIAFMVSFIKDTALVSQIGVFELTFRQELNNQGYSGILVFGTIAFADLILSFPLSMLGQYLEKRLATPRGQRRTRALRSGSSSRHQLLARKGRSAGAGRTIRIRQVDGIAGAGRVDEN